MSTASAHSDEWCQEEVRQPDLCAEQCAQVRGADRGQANASAEAAERAQIELNHKGPNVHWGPRYCQHSCPIQWALKGKSYLKTEFTAYSHFPLVRKLSSPNITCKVEKSALNKVTVDQLPWITKSHNILANVQKTPWQHEWCLVQPDIF